MRRIRAAADGAAGRSRASWRPVPRGPGPRRGHLRASGCGARARSLRLGRRAAASLARGPLRRSLAAELPGRRSPRRTARSRTAFAAGARVPDVVRTCVPDAPVSPAGRESALERARPHVVHANTLLVAARGSGCASVRPAGRAAVARASARRDRRRPLTIRYAAGIADVLVGVSDAVAELLRRHAGSTPVLTVRNGVPEPAAAGSDPSTQPVHGRQRRDRVAHEGHRRVPPGSRTRARASVRTCASSTSAHTTSTADSGLDAELGRARGRDSRRESGARRCSGTRPAAEVLPRWNVFVCSSRSEAFPLATLEAMAMGIPVVATTVGGIPEQIEHLESGVLVRPDDPEAIATWLVRLHDDAGAPHPPGRRRCRARPTRVHARTTGRGAPSGVPDRR